MLIIIYFVEISLARAERNISLLCCAIRYELGIVVLLGVGVIYA